MPLSLQIAQGNARRVAGRKSTSEAIPQDQCVAARIAAWAYYPNTERSDQYMNARREMHHHPPALDKPPHHRVTDNEKFSL
jgi:hypothetical protein